MDHFIDCDVLVIGGGSAGCWAAIRAKDLVDSVVLVDKAKVSRGGMTTFSAGVMLCPLEEDNGDEWLQEIVERGEYLADQDWVAMFLREAPKRVRQLEEWGVPFERDENGKILRVKGRAHRTTRALMYHSKKYIETLRDQTVKRDVKLLERIMITDLLTSDGKHPTEGSVVGAVGVHTRTADFYTFRARATIVAAGGIWGKVWSNSCDNITSDGVAMAYRAGAELTGLEFVCTGHNSIWNRNYQASGLSMIQGNGGRWLNKNGERFMQRYSPELADREALTILCAASAKEVLEGRGPIFADMRSFPEQTWDRFRRVIPFLMTVLDHAEIDPRKQVIENGIDMRVCSASGEGGIRIGLTCASNLPGLFATGDATKDPCQGSQDSAAGINIACNNVSGFIAGESAATYAKSVGSPKLVSSQLNALKESTYLPLRRMGIKGVELFEKILKITTPLDVSMFKHEKRILRTLDQIASLEAKLDMLSASNEHELVIANEAKNYLLVCRLHFATSLQRKESRGWLRREDYPYRDDENWLKWIVVRSGGGGEPTFAFCSIPFERYPVKPKSLGRIPERIQVKLDSKEN